jgi:hypothetical protein
VTARPPGPAWRRRASVRRRPDWAPAGVWRAGSRSGSFAAASCLTGLLLLGFGDGDLADRLRLLRSGEAGGAGLRSSARRSRRARRRAPAAERPGERNVIESSIGGDVRASPG